MKAYDLKVLLEKLKSRGLNVGEDIAKGLVEDVMSWVEESAKASATPIDDLIVGIVGPMKPMLLSQIDKIDGQVG